MVEIKAKICGLSTPESVEAAIEAGATYIGFVFYPPSPRNISPEKASELARVAGGGIDKVGVFVNPDDEFLSSVLELVDLNFIQLHGYETVERVQYLQKRFSVKVIKAISVVSIGDISRAREYEKTTDMLLFDAKAPIEMENSLPGGNGIEFDWNLISNSIWQIPWMLSGGLDATNVSQAVKISGAKIVDISSGIENSPGQKDIEKINSFMNALREIK